MSQYRKRWPCTKKGCTKLELRGSVWRFCKKHDDEKLHEMRTDEQRRLSELRRVPLAQAIYVGMLIDETWFGGDDLNEVYAENCKRVAALSFMAADIFSDHAEKRSR